MTAKICGIPTKLVENLGVIWGTLSCGFEIDPDKFSNICSETKDIYFENIRWFCLPPTLHKVLQHGREIIASCPLPIGLTKEEASEAKNKFIRNFRLHHSRKTSWKEGIQDLFNRLMDKSDPVILETRAAKASQSKRKKSLSLQILSLLKDPEVPSNANESSSENESD